MYLDFLVAEQNRILVPLESESANLQIMMRPNSGPIEIQGL